MKTILCVSDRVEFFAWVSEVLEDFEARESEYILWRSDFRWPGKPDVIVLEPELGPCRGYTVLQQARAFYPETPVVLVCNDLVDNYYGEADAVIRFGALGRRLRSAVQRVREEPAKRCSHHPSRPPPLLTLEPA